MTIGEQIRAAREAAGLSQNDLAEAAGVHRQALSEIERGRVGIGPVRLARIKEALGTTFDTGTDPMNEPDGFTKDEAPRPKKAQGRPPGRPKKAPTVAQIPVAKQIEMLYRLGGQAISPRLPVTANAVVGQAAMCGEAWDAVLRRYPAIYEFIQKGMIAGDIAALVIAHMPIIEAARMELAQRAAQEATYAGGIEQPTAA